MFIILVYEKKTQLPIPLHESSDEIIFTRGESYHNVKQNLEYYPFSPL